MIIKTVWYWPRTRDLDQWSRTENSEKNPHIQGQLIYDIGVKIIQRIKICLFNK